MSVTLRALEAIVSNPLPRAPTTESWIAGIIGDHPSTYSASPRIWNAAFRALDINGWYVPLDVEAASLAQLVETVRATPRFLGANVTVPHKQAVIPLLDHLHPSAERAGAVNTIFPTRGGQLVGANTDGRGGVESMTIAWPGNTMAFQDRLARKCALLIGAGGSGHAVGYALAEALGPAGRLFIVNRTAEAALRLGAAIHDVFGNAQGLDESDAELLAPGLDMVVNASTRGQAGPRATSSGAATYLEPYSALGQAQPPSVVEVEGESEADRKRRWFINAIPDIRANHEASLRFISRVAGHTAFFDLIYAPTETTMLRHARWAGHRTLNGQGMIIFQAVAAFCDFIVRDELDRRGLDAIEARRHVTEAMVAAW